MHRFWLVVPFLLLAAQPAASRPRDDALAGAFRCAVIAESRQWLDCYYGAAQPVRTALNLAPALPAQVKLAAAPPAGGTPRDENVRDDVMSGAANCIRAANERAWLDCYYAAATPMRAHLGLSLPPGMQQAAQQAPAPPAPMPQLASAAPRPAPAAPAGPPPMPRAGGMFTGLFNDARPVVKSMPMRDYSFNQRGGVIVTLQDGQVWEQMDEDEVYHRANWRKPPAQMLVTITPSVMRTFAMKVEGEYGLYKVKRTR